MDEYNITTLPVNGSTNETNSTSAAGGDDEDETFRFAVEGVVLTCVTIFGLVANTIAVIVLVR